MYNIVMDHAHDRSYFYHTLSVPKYLSFWILDTFF